ncbi:MAG TPA: hypothetical protein VJI68_00835 [Candidatus Nanoarchaeia archaeon]|nr:hypothetical protein [Candidatus Nanoarchaeia archaeon]
MDSLEIVAQNYIVEHGKGNSFMNETTLFGFPRCLFQLADSGNRNLFERLVDSYVAYSQKANPKMRPEDVKLEALDFIEFQCMVADTGRMTIGIPGNYVRTGPTLEMFMKIYAGNLARDVGYIPDNSINL